MADGDVFPEPPATAGRLPGIMPCMASTVHVNAVSPFSPCPGRRPALSSARRRPAALAVLVAASLCGCAASPHERLAQRRLEERVGGMRSTLRTTVDRENENYARLSTGTRWAARRVESDLFTFIHNARWVESHIDYDIRRWHANQPAYQRTAAELFWGQPEQIEPTAINMGF